MKKIISHKQSLIIGLIGCFLMVLGIAFSSTFLLIKLIQQSNIEYLAWLIMLVGFNAFLILLIFATNRLGCVVEFNKGNVTRKGFFFGFKKVCRIEDINEIVITTLSFYGDMIVLVDDSKYELDTIRKNSYICLKMNKEHLLLVEKFIKKKIKYI